MRNRGNDLLSSLRAKSLAGTTTATNPFATSTTPTLDIFEDTTAPEKSWDDMLEDYESSLSSFTSGNYDIRAEEGRGYNGSTSLYNQKYGGDDSLENYVGTHSGDFLKGSDGNWTVDLKGASPETVFAGLRQDPRYTQLTEYGTFKEQPDGSYRFVKDEMSTLQKAAAIAEAATMAGITGGVGSALGAGLGISSAAGKGLASGLLGVAQGGDIGDIAKNMALSYAGGAIGDRIAAGTEFGINPFGEQAGMLADQVSGMGDVYGFLPTALGETSSELVKGKSLEDAALGGLVAGAKTIDLEGAGDYATPQVLKDIEKAYIRPIDDIAEGAVAAVYEAQKPIGQAIADVAEPVYEEVIKPAGRAIDDYVIDPVVDAAQYVDDEYIDPFVSTVKEEVFDPLQEVGRDIDREVLQPTKDAIVSAGEAVADAVPDVDLPDIDLPDVDWKGLFGALLAGASGMFSGGGGGGGGTGAPQVAQDAIQTELLDYKPFTPYRSKLSPNARLLG